jgi:hypothetical protein
MHACNAVVLAAGRTGRETRNSFWKLRAKAWILFLSLNGALLFA